MKRLSVLSLLMALTLIFSLLPLSASAETVDVTSLYKKKDVDDEWSAADATVIDLNAVSDPQLTISRKGDYVLCGSYAGQVVIEAPEDAKVRLILNGADIVSPQGPAIYEKSADKLIVTLATDTQNSLTDGPAVTDGDDTIGAALYAEDDLTLNGSGELAVSGTAKHGIQSKADLILAGGVISVSAPVDGIRGRNSVLMLDGEIRVTAGGDGVVSTRTDKEGKGWIVLAGGSLTVTTGSGAGAVKASANSKGGERGGFGRGMAVQATAVSEVSQKAVKAATDLTVLGGTYTFDCADDGLHAANVTVSGGDFSIRSGDDGMHADSELLITAGTIDITQCYEGVEGTNVTVTGGDLRIVASDDGVNASGGGSSGFDMRGGARFGGASSAMLTISGGTLQVTAGGDGLDSNGSIAVTGGTVGVFAATTMGEGAIDFNGTGTISGGLLILASTGGMMSDMASLSGAQLISIPMNGTAGAGSEILVRGTSGSAAASFAPQSAFTSLVIAGDGIAQGAQVSVSVNGSQLFSGAITADMAAQGGAGFGGAGFGGGFGKGGGRNRKGW